MGRRLDAAEAPHGVPAALADQPSHGPIAETPAMGLVIAVPAAAEPGGAAR